MAEQQLTPERAVRLLRAKGAELENWVLHNANGPRPELWQLTADIALIATLLADEIEHTIDISASAETIISTLDRITKHLERLSILPKENEQAFVEGFKEGRPE